MNPRKSIPVTKTTHSKLAETDFKNLEFGKYLSDHMLVAEYSDGRWQEPNVQPFADLSFSPAMLSLHYGQSVFEGMKAFRQNNGRVAVFRPHKHHVRLNRSLARMCMPAIPEDLFMDGLTALLETDEAWIPTSEGSSLYIRPLVFATESRLGVKVSDKYLLIIMTSPVAAYQSKPYRLKAEDHFVRTAEGGTGFAKCAGNYGGAFYPTAMARDEGFDQILWTDYKHHEYIDEVGMMNVMFVINGAIVTPELNTAILEGVTRDTILLLARDLGIPVIERKISLDEIRRGLEDGSVTEAFGTGTAAVVSPIAVIHSHGKDYLVPEATEASLQNKIKARLTAIRNGTEPDGHNWNYLI